MHIILNNNSLVPIYEQLVNQIKNLIIKGELKEYEVLPSVRSLANDLNISALTVKKAYDRLEEESFVQTVHGKGTYVNPTNKAIALEARLKTIEDDLSRVIDKAKSIGLSKEEILEIINIILESEND